MVLEGVTKGFVGSLRDGVRGGLGGMRVIVELEGRGIGTGGALFFEGEDFGVESAFFGVDGAGAGVTGSATRTLGRRAGVGDPL